MPLRPDERRLDQEVLRDGGLGFLLVAGQVEVLDLLGRLRVAEPAGQVVVEVAAPGAHAADVERPPRPGQLVQMVDVVADRQRDADMDVERPERGIAPGAALAQRAAPHVGRLFRDVEGRLPAVGELGGERDVPRADGRDRDRDALPERVVDQLQRLAQAGALAGRQGHGVVPPGIGQRLTPPDLAADLDRLPGPADRRVEGNAMEALDDLGSRGADAELEASVGQVVQAGRGHRQQRRGTRVQLQDPGRDVRLRGPGGHVTETADRVEAVQLGHGDQLDAGLLVVGQLGGGLGEAPPRDRAARR